MPRQAAAITKMRPQSVPPKRSSKSARSNESKHQRHDVEEDQERAADFVGMRAEGCAGDFVNRPVGNCVERGQEWRFA